MNDSYKDFQSPLESFLIHSAKMVMPFPKEHKSLLKEKHSHFKYNKLERDKS